jgi:hypothetical protein
MFTLAMVLQRASALMTERCAQLFAPVADPCSLRQSMELKGLGARLSRELAACAIHHNSATKRRPRHPAE